MIKLRGFLKPYLRECIIGPVFKLAEAVFELLLPTIMAYMVNNGVEKNDSGYIIRCGIIMLVMAVLGFGCSCVCQYFAARASQGFGTDLRNAMFCHIGTLSSSQTDNFGTSSLSSRLVTDVNNLQTGVNMMIRLAIRAPFICIGSVIMAMFLNMRLALILLALIPIFALMLLLIVKFSSPLYTSVLKTLDDMTSKVRENLLGIRVISAFCTFEREKNAFEDINNHYTRELNRVGRISALLSPFTTVIVNFAIMVVLWRGGLMLTGGDFLIGDIVAFVNYASQILLAMIVVSNLIGIFTRAAASAVRVREILNTVNELTHGNIIPQHNEVAVEMENVSFSYNKGADTAVKDISLKISSGEQIGIIGGTGSGKTTLIRLMMYDYAADTGTVKVMGERVESIDENKLCDIISCVPQKTSLISGTIKSNIGMGKALSDEEIKKACRIAQIDSYIESLPQKYDTPVLRDGKNFSGGQRQRLAIARAVAKESDILILDDSASALDFKTEKKLRDAIRDSFDNKTVIIVSQRVSSIRHCDRIMVMADGEIVGTGNHKELFNNCEMYRSICFHQLSANELEVLKQ
ncbi:MAG: ABC transporter ATP-binding protein [Ruminococcaceae bacterium]|nr:ABC transporter ATP-binding protein [Oscillospiraceae bacterium]